MLMIRNENVMFSIIDLKDGNELTRTMKSGLLIINGNCTPFVLRSVAHGSVKKMTEAFETHIVVQCFDQAKTLFTKNGYTSVQIANTHGMIWVYIKTEHLRDFFSAVCMATN